LERRSGIALRGITDISLVEGAEEERVKTRKVNE